MKKNKSVACNYCGKKFTSEMGLKVHLTRAKNRNTKKINCIGLEQRMMLAQEKPTLKWFVKILSQLKDSEVAIDLETIHILNNFNPIIGPLRITIRQDILVKNLGKW